MDSQNSNQPSGATNLFSKLKSKDPLVIMGIVLLVFGIALTVYGFIPQTTINYQVISQDVVNVPVNATGGFISSSQAAQIAYNEFSIPPAQVYCYSSTAGYTCEGEQNLGLKTYTSDPGKEYGGAIDAVGLASIYFGFKYEPLIPRKRELRAIRFRVDEDICIANSVCVELAPKVFQLKKQDTPSILAPLAYVVDPYGASNDEILIAAQMCPTGAIIIEDAETGERIHPPLPD